MAEYKFTKDIVEGEQGEDFIIEYLSKSRNGQLIEKRKDHAWDFKMQFPSGDILTFESKTDVFCIPPKILNGKTINGRDTGNIFVEFTSWGRETGINVTTADWFVYYYKFLGELWFIKVDELKKLIEENQFKIGSGGDAGSDSAGYLIPRRLFRDKFLVRTDL